MSCRAVLGRDCRPGLSKTVGRAVRHARLVAPGSELVAEAGRRKGLAEAGHEKRKRA
jgi:hypothetical protein